MILLLAPDLISETMNRAEQLSLELFSSGLEAEVHSDVSLTFLEALSI